MEISQYENVFYRFINKKPYLIGSKCEVCKYIAFPKKVVCPACVSKKNMKEINLNGKGKIETFSVLHVGPPGFSLPYMVAYIKLVEGPRIFSMIEGCSVSENALDIGTEVELTIGKIYIDENGNEIINYKFRPIESI